MRKSSQDQSRQIQPEDRRWIDHYLRAMRAERGLSAHTIAAYDRDLTGVALALKSGQSIVAADAGSLRSVIKLWADDLSARTVARKLSALRQFMAFLVAEGEREDDPSLYLDAPKQEKSLPKGLDESQINALIATAQSDESPDGIMMRAMLELLYGAGLRVSEMIQLDANLMNRRNDHITIKGKGGKDRVVMLTDAALNAAEQWLHYRDQLPDAIASKYLFPSKQDARQPISRNQVYGLLRALGVKAGIGSVSPHMLRHSFATHMLNRGADLRSLQILLGHADISTTEIYTNTQDNRLAGLVHDTHPLARNKDIDV